MKPTWDELAKEYAGSANVVIADVDCTADDAKDVCEKHGVSGYPTIKYWTKDSKESKDYSGGREIADLKEFVEENLAGPDPFTTLTSIDEFQKWTQGEGPSVLVLGVFRTPTVGALYNGWKGSSRKLKDSAQFGVYAQSSYDAGAKKYTQSELEKQLGTTAPKVLISTDKGKTWSRCVVPARTSTTQKERVDAISECTKGEGLKPLKK